MAWVYLDDGFSENRKVLAVGGDAAWLFVCGLCFCNRTLTDGRIPKAMVPRLSDRKYPKQLAAQLVGVGLWHDRGDHYEVHDYGDYQPTAEVVRAKREQARKAAQSRWAPKPRPPSGEQCEPHADRIAESTTDSTTDSNPNSNAETMPRTRVPSPSPNPSSSPLPPSDEEEHENPIRKAARLEATRRMENTTTGIVNPSGYLRVVTDDVLAEYAVVMHDWHAEGLTAEEMAVRLRPTNGATDPPIYDRFGAKEPVWADDDFDPDRNVVVRKPQ